ncbi:MAG: hypothetical protein SGARI_000229 [Bacillariaceae sp.]
MLTMGVTVGSYAFTSPNEWPLQTFPFFEEVASQFRNVTGTGVIALAPLVYSVDKPEWELYSVENQGWLDESYATMGWQADPYPIQPAVYEIHDSGVLVESEASITMPLWQRSEPPKDTGVINFNLLSDRDVQLTYNSVVSLKKGEIGPVKDVSAIFGGNHEDSDHFDEHEGSLHFENENDTPESLYMQPITELHAEVSFEDSTSDSVSIVATLVSSLLWDEFYSGLYHDTADADGMIVVSEESCPWQEEEVIFTYELHGTDASYLGPGDLHDRAYNDFGHHTYLSDDPQTHACTYNLHIYPSAAVEAANTSNEPLIYTIIMVMLFVATAIGFIVYDYFVQRRQREATLEMARSNAIVSSLFPAEIRDRLLAEEDNKKKSTKDSDKGLNPGTQKFRLQNFMDEEAEAAEQNTKAAAKKLDGVILDSKPIADLFPNTTVLFADIAGFTAWSSVREPSQVFTLLETVYKAFDKIAKRRKVFKVETVGDCYVSMMPGCEPVDDHAVIMCRFARECLTQFNQLASQLEVILGPDTGDLNVRVGIHSGAVTAGVLRGDKSRFQLFGDTVNTAARIESSGKRDHIHLSHETAELLHAAGMSNWLTKREDTINAKGKGEMQTYWLLTEQQLASGGVVDNTANKTAAPLPMVKALQPRLAKTTNEILDPESALPPKIKRLVDWNCDVLKRMLKQIVARRNAEARQQYDMNHPLMMKVEMNIGCDTYVLDEVAEIIRLPGYSDVKVTEDPNSIVLPEGVEEQLRLYVSSVAAMYRDNPFHNFEHASHVMMSVSKLLSRIVAPDDVAHDDANLHDHTYGITSDPLTQFSVILSALIHDVDHAGVSNAQLIKEGAKIADVFKKKSVAEQNSIVLAWDRLMESRFAALRGCIYSDPDELKRFRQLMVNTVMATDIFDKELSALRKNRWDVAFKKIAVEQESTPEDDINPSYSSI